MTRINTNVSSLVAQNRLNKTNSDLQTALTRLSTGLRINTGKDDPAGLIASEALRTDITSINKAISNTQRSAQIIATADSALGQVSSLLNDIRGLVVEAANSGALSADEIAANQLQVDSSLEAINRIAANTTFQGRKLLDGSLDFITSSGTNFSKLTNLQINQANLGVTGSVSLDLQVTTAATRAKIEVADIPAAGVAGTGSITLANKAAGVEAVTADLTTTAGAEFTVAAKDGGDFDGTAGNDLKLTIVAGETAATKSALSTVQTVGTGTVGDFTIGIKDSSTKFAGSLGNAVTYDIKSGNTATAQAVSEAQDVNGFTGAFTIRAKAGGAYDGVDGNVIGVTIVKDAAPTVAADAAAVAGNVLAIKVDDATSQSLSAIKAALEADAQFKDDFEFIIADGAENVLFRNDGSDDLSVAFELDGDIDGADADTKVSFDSGTSKLTILVNRNANTKLSAIKAAIEADATFSNDFVINLGTDATFRSTGVLDDKAAVALSGGTNELAEFTRVGNNLTVKVSDSAATQTLANIKTALAAIDDFNDHFALTIGTGGNFATDGSDDVTDATFSGGTDTDQGNDVLNITGPSGAVNNGSVTINQSSSVTTPTAAVDDDGNITITVSSTAATTLAQIKTAIDALDGYAASIGTSAGDSSFDPTIDEFTTVAVTGATDGGITKDAVFELGSQIGSQVFQISAGTTIDQLISQINLVKDATGVEASADDDTLVLQSTTYGSKASVDLRIINEDATGTFTSAVGIRSRDTGTDVVAKLNGVDVSGDGNSLKVSNSTLDLSLSLTAGFTGSINFGITGGGAKFQLGPEVVANQQARIGIGSVNSARLGGVSGRLYELGEGGLAALATNPNLAAEIVDEAINQVTGLRGRLGAFQATTLESNLVSLNDTVANLQEAESSIRDADFAAESARLTRAQILVQSGTSVLSIANQNPQNVLGLLR